MGRLSVVRYSVRLAQFNQTRPMAGNRGGSMRRFKSRTCLVFLGCVSSLAPISRNAYPQASSTAAPSPQEKVAALKQSLAKNQAALKAYTWTETTQISLKGEVKKQQQKLCHYGPDGKVQKTELPGSTPAQQPQEQGGGRRRGAVK